ncbi:polyphosphate polymerase domain-containing protein [Actinoplanes sp. M2I2]|uniref:polyphosphate polymerase domain-containing protein n=1 Tax=Actinoplanes sp. M2I2 TaxID=1734444 RepID=UPI00202260A4|nr:polyphosphate polymerase domain-containing protein [Actinoplanes sp. M2I2]
MIAVADELATHFAPVTLAELNERAGLLTRVDRKYLLPATELPSVLAALPDDTQALEIDARRRFGYRSAYFDTPGLDSYHGAARRRRRRFKLRVRTYVDSDLRFLEVKTRGARGTTVKQRFPYAGSDDLLAPADTELAVTALSRAGVPDVGRHFDLALTTEYERITLLLPSTGSRVTVDLGLTWSLPGGTALSLPGRVIVETKSDRATSPVDRLLWSLAHRPVPISKYATGLAALRPDLPATRWCPVLRRHFADPETSRS